MSRFVSVLSLGLTLSIAASADALTTVATSALRSESGNALVSKALSTPANAQAIAKILGVSEAALRTQGAEATRTQLLSKLNSSDAATNSRVAQLLNVKGGESGGTTANSLVANGSGSGSGGISAALTEARAEQALQLDKGAVQAAREYVAATEPTEVQAFEGLVADAANTNDDATKNVARGYITLMGPRGTGPFHLKPSAVRRSLKWKAPARKNYGDVLIGAAGRLPTTLLREDAFKAELVSRNMLEKYQKGCVRQ